MMLSSPFVLVEYDTGILEQDTHCLVKQKPNPRREISSL